MKFTAIAATLAMTLATMPVAVLAQGAGAAATCPNLMITYENVSKEMAANTASSITDNSAPRATLREMENANALSRANIALNLMRDNKCPLPKEAPDGVTYLSAALKCRGDLLESSASERPATCERSNWTRSGS